MAVVHEQSGLLGWWIPEGEEPLFHIEGLLPLVSDVRQPVHVIRHGQRGGIGLARGGRVYGPGAEDAAAPKQYEWLGTLAPLYPEWLGDRSFQEAHGVRFPYIVGAMANGIATTDMVINAGRAGLLGFFGAAGLPLSRVEAAIVAMKAALAGRGIPFGVNLIHNPQQPEMEEQSVDLFLKHGVTKVSVSAFMQMSPAIVRYACKGLHLDPQGNILRTNHLFAKLSRPAVAEPFMMPAPPRMVADLVQRGQLTRQEAELAALVPLAEDVTVEADSGGHTDNRPLTVLFPTIMDLAQRISAARGYRRPLRIGAGGGIGTPGAAAAAFALGAAYVITGSVNQGAVESGLSTTGKEMLAQAGLADVAMAPAADMFEMGVKVQVLQRGTLFSLRAAQLYDLYKTYDSLAALPAPVLQKLQRDIFRAPVEEIWSETKTFFSRRDPSQLERAERDPKHKMALVFRWYLGNATGWAIKGVPERRQDYQIWCGPAIGAFNAWTRDTFLARAEERTVAQIAYNIMEGAAVITRAQQLRSYGLPLPAEAFNYPPQPLVAGSV